MTNETTGGAVNGAPAGLTNAEKLAAIETYLKTLTAIAASLRHTVTIEMGLTRAERVGAYLPDGSKIGAVSRSEGRMSAKVVDEAAALAWCLERYPDEVQTVPAVRVVRPAFLKYLTDAAKADEAKDGDLGVDPRTGEELPFIKVSQGAPYVSVTTTTAGVQRMEALAYGFAGQLEAKP